MKKYFLVEFTTPQGLVSSANYYAEDELEAIEFFRLDFGGVPVIEYCEEAFEPSEDEEDSMDGDAGSALASAGWGTDEDYGFADEVM